MSAYWMQVALSDLAAIEHWYAALDGDYADGVGRAAVAAARFLVEFPASGPVVDGEIRKGQAPSTEYILLHRIVDDGIEVDRIESVRRNWRPSQT